MGCPQRAWGVHGACAVSTECAGVHRAWGIHRACAVSTEREVSTECAGVHRARGVSTEHMRCPRSMQVSTEYMRCPQNVQVSTERVGCPRSTCGVHGVCKCPQSTWGVHRACGCPRSVRVSTERVGVHGACGVSTKRVGCPWSVQVSTERGESSEHWPPCPFILPAESLCLTLPAWGQDRPATPPHGTQCLRPPVSARRGAFPCTWARLQPQGHHDTLCACGSPAREPKNSAKHTLSGRRHFPACTHLHTLRHPSGPTSPLPGPRRPSVPQGSHNHPPAVLLQNF
uniref:Uncharacterized protein n=1 Tax=Myotis myotis TaxID=51298 RepID=A0A7J7R2B8_MYOMY|nr:hypothetical protein mMyoMyo1_010926 [Myotis myotis]